MNLKHSKNIFNGGVKLNLGVNGIHIKRRPVIQKKILPALFTLSLILSACTTTEKFSETGKSTENVFHEPESLTLLFGGDIMAHEENFLMKDFSLIWNDVKPLVSGADLSFANIEAPVMDEKKWSGYPKFNMHSDYVQKAVDAGFNVFSLSNNHSTDLGLKGILSTKKTFENLQKENKTSERPIYFSGIKEEPYEDNFDYTLIEKNGFRIIFIAITELLNIPVHTETLNYVPPTKKEREKLIEFIKNIRAQEKTDFLILSVHTSEEEYVLNVNEKRKSFYRELLSCGVDVLWANHPHVVREYEIYGDINDSLIKKLIFYGNGNTISGQRRNPMLSKPENPRENTGDGLLFEVKLIKHYNKEYPQVSVSETKAYYITTYIDSEKNFVVKKLDDTFIEALEKEKRYDWASYIKSRKKISESTKETVIWQ